MSLLVENVDVSLAKLAFFIFASAFFKKFNAKCLAKSNILETQVKLLFLFTYVDFVSGRLRTGVPKNRTYNKTSWNFQGQI